MGISSTEKRKKGTVVEGGGREGKGREYHDAFM